MNVGSPPLLVVHVYLVMGAGHAAPRSHLLPHPLFAFAEAPAIPCFPDASRFTRTSWSVTTSPPSSRQPVTTSTVHCRIPLSVDPSIHRHARLPSYRQTPTPAPAPAPPMPQGEALSAIQPPPTGPEPRTAVPAADDNPYYWQPAVPTPPHFRILAPSLPAPSTSRPPGPSTLAAAAAEGVRGGGGEGGEGDGGGGGACAAAAAMASLHAGGLEGLPLFPLEGVQIFPGQTIQVRVWQLGHCPGILWPYVVFMGQVLAELHTYRARTCPSGIRSHRSFPPSFFHWSPVFPAAVLEMRYRQAASPRSPRSSPPAANHSCSTRTVDSTGLCFLDPMWNPVSYSCASTRSATGCSPRPAWSRGGPSGCAGTAWAQPPWCEGGRGCVNTRGGVGC